MNRTPIAVSSTADQIISDLTTRQFLKPHDSIQAALMASASAVGYCPRAAEHAMRWLDLNPATAIGRLRRTEITQLSHSVYRFWTRALHLTSASTD